MTLLFLFGELDKKTNQQESIPVWGQHKTCKKEAICNLLHVHFFIETFPLHS